MKIANLTLALGLTLFLAGCGDSGTGLEATDLEGTWTAAQMEYTDNANSGTVVDIIARDGATLTLTVDAAGQATSLFDNGIGGSSSDSGALGSTGTTLTLGGQVFQATRNGNVLTLVDTNDQFDFGSGNETSATLTVVMNRR